MRGRKPIPSAIKAITGQGRWQSKAQTATEPKPPVGLGNPPGHLSRLAKRIWRDLAPRIEQMKLGTVADREAFSMLCDAQANWQELTAMVRTSGLVTKVNGSPCINPLLKRADIEADKARRLLVEFGMTPSARTRLHVEMDSLDEDLIMEFLKPLVVVPPPEAAALAAAAAAAAAPMPPTPARPARPVRQHAARQA